MPILPSGTVNSGSSAPGSVQPSNATPNVRVAAFAASATRITPGRSSPSSAAALAHLKTVKSPAMPRLFDSSPFGALAMSSVTALGQGGSGITATVAYFEHLLEFGLATSTVAGREEGIVVQTPAQASYEAEQAVTISAPPERVYLFDPDSGERLR